MQALVPLENFDFDVGGGHWNVFEQNSVMV